MEDYLCKLPDDIFCHIFSLLPVRDAVRARLSLLSWKCLPDFRSELQFDATNVLGKDPFNCERSECQSMFVKAIDQFLDLWKGRKISMLRLCYCLGNEDSLHINRWIALAIRMDVQKIDLHLSHGKSSMDNYIFPSHLMVYLNRPCLKHLYLTSCILTIPFGCTSWLSHLSTLELKCVPLDQSILECIFSSGLNLISLRLSLCDLPKNLCIHVLSLKKLLIADTLHGIELKCPNLEIFQYTGRARTMTFTHIPILREAKLFLFHKEKGCSVIFDELTRGALQLQALTLLITSEVTSFLSVTNFRCQLKQLDLHFKVPIGFDLLTITYLLRASTFLQLLNITLDYCDYKYKIQTRAKEYHHFLHFELKEVRIKGHGQMIVDLVLHLLKHAVQLKKITIICAERYKQAMSLVLQDKIRPTVQLIFL